MFIMVMGLSEPWTLGILRRKVWIRWQQNIDERLFEGTERVSNESENLWLSSGHSSTRRRMQLSILPEDYHTNGKGLGVGDSSRYGEL